VSGADLVNAGRSALKKHDKKVTLKDFYEVKSIEKQERFKVKTLNIRKNRTEVFESKSVIIATGVVDRQPEIEGSIRHILPYANKGLVHYCLFCDGHMMTGQDVAVFGHNELAVRTAEDLNWFEAQSVTIMTNGKEMFEGQDMDEIKKKELLDKMADLEVETVTTRITELFGLKDNRLGMKLADGSEKKFGAGMNALGLYRVNNELAALLGGKLDNEGYVLTNEDCRVLDHQDKPIDGLYAVGDIRSEWNQIVIGYGDAERAVMNAYAYYL
ncbi:MAG: NAD(P)/FAD-dependent oxidoreductase, partial [Thermoplasmata archaeon]|nr:NAD(P)/FAD-dependent oxidoreductase [Thermoplasmata archaeon]